MQLVASPSLLPKGKAIFLARKSVCEAAALRITQFTTQCNRWLEKVAMSTWTSSLGSQALYGGHEGHGMQGKRTPKKLAHDLSPSQEVRGDGDSVHGNLSSFRQLQLSTVHTCTICKLDHTVCLLSCSYCLSHNVYKEIASWQQPLFKPCPSLFVVLFSSSSFDSQLPRSDPGLWPLLYLCEQCALTLSSPPPTP